MTAESALGRVNDGISLLEKGDRYRAEMAFRDAIRLDPDCVEAHVRPGWVLLHREENLDAGAVFQSALRIDLDSAAAHEGLGLVLFNEGRHAAAEAEYRRAIRLAPGNAIASSRLAESLYAQNRYIEAEIAALDAVRTEPGLSMAHVSLGRALQRLGHGETLANTTERLTRKFKVSTLVILRRLYDAGMLSWEEYRSAYDSEFRRLTGLLGERASGGGNFYNTQPTHWVDEANAAGTVYSIDSVRTELIAGNDDLSAWVQQRPGSFFISPSAATLPSLQATSIWA